MQGKLIVFEGTDSSGKKTQAKILAERLREEGNKVEEADFPQYYSSFHGKLIARYLRGEFGDVSPYLASLLYAGDRLEAKDRLLNWLNEGKIIIANRYVTSNVAFMSARIEPEKRQEFIEWLETLEYDINKIPRPDLVLFLNVPVEVTQRWIKTKEERKYLNGKKKDIHEKDIPYLKEVEQTYLGLAKRDNWKIIDCMEDKPLSIEEISKKVYTAVKSRIG